MLIKKEVLEKIAEKKFISECWKYGICPKCGGEEFIKGTDINRANCHRQYGIDETRYCVVCLSESDKKIIKSSNTTCDICLGSDVCPHPEKGKSSCVLDDDIDDHTSVWGGSGPDCMPGRLEAAI